MIEAYAEFDLVCGDYATGYFYGYDVKDHWMIKQIIIRW